MSFCHFMLRVIEAIEYKRTDDKRQEKTHLDAFKCILRNHIYRLPVYVGTQNKISQHCPSCVATGCTASLVGLERTFVESL